MNRDQVAKKDRPGNYTVKAGDTLSSISKKLGIADWHTIYNKNKAIIGANPGAIKAGQVYTV